MTKPLPPRDKRLALRELVNLPEGTEVEYWRNIGTTYGLMNPLKIDSEGFAVGRDDDPITWNRYYTYALAPKKVRRLKPLHVILSEAEGYTITNYGNFHIDGYLITTHPDLIKYFRDRGPEGRTDWPDSWYEEIEND